MKSFLKVAAVNAAVLLGLLLLVELILGNWVRPMSIGDLKRFSIPIDVKFTYDVSPLYGPPGVPREIRYTRDGWGLRGDFTALSDVDLLTVGGSTTDQKFLDDRETWQAFTQAELAARGRDVTIANAGVDGQSTTGHLFDFDNWFNLLPELKPKTILFYAGINDVMKTAARGQFDGSLDKDNWRVKSATWQLVRLVRGGMQARNAQVVHGRKLEHAESDFTEQGLIDAATRERIAGDVAADFLRNVDQLAGRSRALGARPVFVTQTAYGWNAAVGGAPRGLTDRTRAHGVEMNYADVSFIHQRLNAALMEHCAKQGYACFDLASEIRLEPADFYDNLHTSPSGAKKIGAYLAEKLAGLTT
jgi:lysophospholipase L1-like esterase